MRIVTIKKIGFMGSGPPSEWSPGVMIAITVIVVQRSAVTRRAAAKLYLSDRVSGSLNRIAMREVATKQGTMSTPIITPRMICESTRNVNQSNRRAAGIRMQ